MMRQLIEVFPLSIYAALSIFIFLTIFLFVIFRLVYGETSESLAQKARMPLEDSDLESGVQR